MIKALSKFFSVNVINSIEPRKKTILSASKVPQKIPTMVDFEKKPLRIFLRSFVEKIITPKVEIIIPKIAYILR